MLKMNTREVGGIAVIDCAGRIVFGEETAALREEVKRRLEQERHIVLNLGAVTYVDSGGLGTLVALHSAAKASGTTIKLANLTPRVNDLLQVTKLVDVLEVYESELRAIESLRHRAVA